MSFRMRVRTLKGDTYEVACEPSDTVMAVKGLIEQSKGHPSAHQKLIYNGNILVRHKEPVFLLLLFFSSPFFVFLLAKCSLFDCAERRQDGGGEQH